MRNGPSARCDNQGNKPMIPRTLTQMQHRPTSYEVVAKHEDGQEIRLAFTERRTKRCLLHIHQSNGQKILDMLGQWDGIATYSSNSGWIFGPVSIRFSGRTERDLASEMYFI